MSDQQDLLDLLPEIKAVPQEQIKQCDMPIGIYLQEAENLHTRAAADLSFLSTAGMTTELLDKLLPRIGALRTAQGNWEELNTVLDDALEDWKAEWPAFVEFRDDLIDNMDFAYRNDEALLNKIRLIKEGSSHADTIQDMANLSVLGKANTPPLEAINFDLSLLDQAAEKADRMSGLLGAVNGEMYVDDTFKVVRDQAFTFLKEVVDEIRNYGRFVFRKNKNHVKSYSSKYNRDKYRAYKRRQEEETQEES